MDDRSKDIARGEYRGPASRCDDGVEADAFHALVDGGAIENAELLSDIRSRIRRSLDDPRPSLTLDQVDAFIDALASKARTEAGRA